MSRLVPALVLGLVGACAAPTEIVVFVDSDLPLAPRTPSIAVGDGELRYLSITIDCFAEPDDPACDIEDRGPRLSMGFGQDYTQTAAGVAPPFYLGLLRDGDLDRTLRVEVVGLVGPEGPGESFVAASATTRFVDGRSKALTLFLYASCVDVTCDGGETCTSDGSCVPEERNGAELPDWDGDCTALALPAADGSPRDCVERTRFE